MSRFNAAKLGKEVRFKRGTKSLRDITKETGLSVTTLHRIEKESKIDIETLFTICGWLGMSVDDFDNLKNENKKP